ncbi:MAG: hypothetical protein U5O39_00340 [Gammaproteobacteria bacterium]|nr:hypothetical protein [Gammaproteobacteria bacterium]
MDADAKILVFCKAPVEGQVKTRLSVLVGDEAACQIHEELATR